MFQLLIISNIRVRTFFGWDMYRQYFNLFVVRLQSANVIRHIGSLYSVKIINFTWNFKTFFKAIIFDKLWVGF